MKLEQKKAKKSSFSKNFQNNLVFSIFMKNVSLFNFWLAIRNNLKGKDQN